jgi:uncharacterized protein
MRIINETRASVLAVQAPLAATFFSRLTGLLNRKKLLPGEGLILDPSNSIHSFFMRFSFDAVFLDKENTVVGLLRSFKPFRISPIFLSARITLELPVNTIDVSATAIGDRIRIIP